MDRLADTGACSSPRRLAAEVMRLRCQLSADVPIVRTNSRKNLPRSPGWCDHLAMSFTLRARNRAGVLVSALVALSAPGLANMPAAVSVSLDPANARQAQATATSAPLVKPKVLKKLTLTPVSVPSPLVNGTTLTFTGTTPKALRGKKVLLMRQVDAQRWISVGRARVAKDRTFKVNGIVTGSGTNTWRVKTTLNRGRKKPALVYVSPARKMTVYSWRYLADAEAVGGFRNMMSTGRATVGGVSFSKSLFNSWG
jgi:hypothetical protein